jgi:hypothetical protein
MTEQLESELRAALRERAAQVPAASIARLTHVDYHPRTRRLRPPLAIGALASAAGAAGAAAIVISLTAGASNAFAGWTATPTAPLPGQLAAAQASCEASQPPIAGLPLTLTDTRGPFTFSVYANSNSSATCFKGPGFMSTSANVASAALNVPTGQVLLSSSHRTERGGHAFSLADGRTGPGVSGVTLSLDDGTNVRATVGGGWFVAWWPSGHEIKSAELTTPTGTVTQTFNLSPEIPCGTQRCAAGMSESGSVGGGSVSGSSVTGGSVTGSFGVTGSDAGGSATSSLSR